MTKRRFQTIVPMIAVAFFVAFLPHVCLAQESENPALETAKGELLRVDPDAQTIAILSADGTELEFSYDMETQIMGAEEGVAGLETESGSQVTVHFRLEEDGVRKAVRIEIESST